MAGLAKKERWRKYVDRSRSRTSEGDGVEEAKEGRLETSIAVPAGVPSGKAADVNANASETRMAAETGATRGI
jgi:hypothetical protein